MEEIRKNVQETLPSLASDLLDNLVLKLTETCGVAEVADLEFISEKDLLDLLKPVQVRKLLRSWQVKGKLLQFLSIQ